MPTYITTLTPREVQLVEEILERERERDPDEWDDPTTHARVNALYDRVFASVESKSTLVLSRLELVLLSDMLDATADNIDDDIHEGGTHPEREEIVSLARRVYKVIAPDDWRRR